MIPKHIHPHNCLVKLGVRALRDIVIQVLFIPQCVHAFEHKVEQRLQVLRARARHENIRIPMRERRSDRQTQRRALAPAAGRGQGNRRRQRLLRNRIDEGQDRLRLVDGPGELDEVPGGLGVGELGLELLELRRGLVLGFPGGVRDGGDVFAPRDGEDVQLVVEDEAVLAGTEGEDESLVEACDDGVVGGGAVPGVDVLREGQFVRR